MTAYISQDQNRAHDQGHNVVHYWRICARKIWRGKRTPEL